MNNIILPKYIVLTNITNIQVETFCTCCGRKLLHPNYIKNTETNETFYLGSTCTKKYLGLSVKEINEENDTYNTDTAKADAFEKSKSARRTFVESFKEVNSEMMAYIVNNQSNNFIKSMKERIEETGTLTKNMYAVVYSMMLEVADLPDKFKDLEFTAIRFTKKEGHFGISYTLYGETEDHKLIRVFFSSMNEKHNDIMIENKIYDTEGFTSDNILERKLKFTVSGSFDGYKIKRAKLSSFKEAIMLVSV